MTKKRIELIDYIKAVCVVFVIITHGDFLNDAMLDKSGLFYLLAVNKAVPAFLFLSGYVYALSAKGSLGELYDKRKLTAKLLRLSIPTVIAYICFVLITSMTANPMSIYDIARRFLAGDWGRGSYYFHIMTQFVLLAPVMFSLVRKFSRWGVVIIGSVNLVYELLWTLTSPPDGLYRVIFLRYLLVTALGMYFANKKHQRTSPVVIGAMFLTGAVYILLPYFTHYEYKIFTVDPWNRSGMMSAFYVAAVMYVLFYVFGKRGIKGIVGKAVSFVGQASYHIMYTQMLYFVIRPAFDRLIFPVTTLPLLVQYMVDIVVSVGLGLVFCVADNKFFGKFYRIK